MKMLEVISVYDWPVQYRRLFLILLPISLPLWLAYTVTVLLVVLLMLLLLTPVAFVLELWCEETKT